MSAAEVVKAGQAAFSYKIERAVLNRNRQYKLRQYVIIPESVGHGLVLEIGWTKEGEDLELTLRREEVEVRR